MRESDELASAFVELEALVRENSRMPGLAAARDEARRRRGRRIAWAAAGTVVLVLAGVAAAIPNWIRQSGPPVLNPSPSATTGTPSPSGTTPSPTVTTDATPATVLGNMMPPDRIRNATLDVPAFELAGCPSGRLQFRDQGFSSSEGVVLMEFAAVGDIDADGLEDVVVALRCAPGGSGHVTPAVQVLAYSGPGLSLLGAIPTGGRTTVTSLVVGPDGQIVLGMAQTGPAEAIVVDRYYWSGSEITLMENTVIPADALPVVAVSAEPATVQLAPGGPGATIVVTVRNEGPTAALPLRLIVVWSQPVAVDVEGFASATAEARHELLIAAPRAGQSVTITLRTTMLAGATLPAGSAILVVVEGGRADAVDSDTFRISLQPA